MASKKYDLIGVLGYQFSDEWEIPQHLNERLTLIADLFKKNHASFIGLTGKWSLAFDHREIKPPVTEASLMEQHLIRLGVPQSNILKETQSKDTIGNAYYMKTEIVIPHKFKSILVACADYHLKRSEHIFRKIFGEEYTIDFLPTSTPLGNTPEFMKMQDNIHVHQKRFLGPMKDGDHTYLVDKLYLDPFFSKK